MYQRRVRNGLDFNISLTIECRPPHELEPELGTEFLELSVLQKRLIPPRTPPDGFAAWLPYEGADPFGVSGLLLATIGFYGVIAYTVALQTPKVGFRTEI